MEALLLLFGCCSRHPIMAWTNCFSIFGYKANLWFPIQSVWLFASVAIACEKPSFAPSILFYGIAWIMMSLNYYNSRHPHHWCRVKRFESLIIGIITGSSSSLSSTDSVAPNESVAERHHFDALDNLKADRMAALISAFLATGLKVYGIYR